MIVLEFIFVFFLLAYALLLIVVTLGTIWSIITGNIWKIRVPWGFMFFNFFGNSNDGD